MSEAGFFIFNRVYSFGTELIFAVLFTAFFHPFMTAQDRKWRSLLMIFSVYMLIGMICDWASLPRTSFGLILTAVLLVVSKWIGVEKSLIFLLTVLYFNTRISSGLIAESLYFTLGRRLPFPEEPLEAILSHAATLAVVYLPLIPLNLYLVHSPNIRQNNDPLRTGKGRRLACFQASSHLVEQSVLYRVYLGEDAQMQNYVSDGTAYYNYNYDRDPVLRWSDYIALRTVAGHSAAGPEQGRYLIHCMPYLGELLRDYDRSLTVGGVTLAPGSLYTEHLSQSFGTANGRGYILVVPDEAAEGLDIHHLAYDAKTVDPVAAAHFKDLTDIAAGERARSGNYTYISTRADEEAMVAEQTTMFIFPMFYLALALTMTAAAILTIQQLSETELYRRQFALLGKLGMDRREMGRALREQFAIYYAMPAVPALLIAVPFILDLAQAPEPGVMVGMNSPAVIVTISVPGITLDGKTCILIGKFSCSLFY